MTHSQQPRPAAFIDRDGTLIRDVDYLSSTDDLEVFDFSRKALEMLRENDYLIIVVTNQSGIGRGFFDSQTVVAINAEMNQRLGDLIDAFYFCPHLPDDGCECRKPSAGLIRNAMNDLEIDIANSWTIGDKASDIELGMNAGTATALVLTGYGESELPGLGRMPDVVAADLLAAVNEICSRSD